MLDSGHLKMNDKCFYRRPNHIQLHFTRYNTPSLVVSSIQYCRMMIKSVQSMPQYMSKGDAKYELRS